MIAVEQAAEIFVITDPEANIQYVNPAFEEATGYSHKETIGQNPRILKSGVQDDAFYRELWDTLTAGKTWKGRFVNKRKDDSFYTEEAIISPVHDSKGEIIHYTAVKRDITEDLRKSEMLAQSQKMQSIGRLAGGVAHDFNNMLNVIMGHTELAREYLSADNPMRANLDEVLKAAQRSANLTRQLLGFARKQTIIPKHLNLNDTIKSMITMLEHLIGENIRLVWKPGELKQILIDPVQIDQLLANLVVNARDAIKNENGIITIETGSVRLNEEYCKAYGDCFAGDYLMLAVSDNGCGMDEETKENIFDPFFTTKDVGEGTGLGLATVYGIVKQNKGFINTYSELNLGTTFKIYFPLLVEEQDYIELIDTQNIQPIIGRETILIVEDEEAILNMTADILSNQGYTVLTALTPGKAFKLAAENSEKIALLLTDVIMPEMNGHKLADKLKLICPNMKIIFMSGYTADIIEQQGVLEENVKFLQKPFLNNVLSEAIRKVLDE
jgi:two-component system cell cycle sensor histidine kinase/response regulator CckA